LIFGIWLARGLHRFFFFLAGAFLGMALGQFAFELGRLWFPVVETHASAWHPTLVCAGIVVGGFGMMLAARWAIALLSASVGALLVTSSFPSEPLVLLAAPPIALGSFLFQIGVLRRLAPKTGGRRRNDPDDEDEEDEE
jgi:hypothetical protein